MITDQKYHSWLTKQAVTFGFKYGVDSEDLLQDFFAAALEGKSAKFEYIFFESIKKEYLRGMTGTSKAKPFVFDPEILKQIKNNKRGMTDYEFIEYLCDLRTTLTEKEYQLVCMYLIGFDQYEIWQKVKDVSRRELAALWKKVGLKRGLA